MSYLVAEYLCPDCGVRLERFEKRDDVPRETKCDCGAHAEHVISAPGLAIPRFWVDKGKSDPRPPGVLDTRPLAEGMSLGEWRRKTREDHRKKRAAELRKEMGAKQYFS